MANLVEEVVKVHDPDGDTDDADELGELVAELLEPELKRTALLLVLLGLLHLKCKEKPASGFCRSACSVR